MRECSSFQSILFFILFSAWAITFHVHADDTIKVYGHKDLKGLDENSIQQQQNISSETIHKKTAKTLIDALEGEHGIDVQTVCGNCGARRVSINGMKGEHTGVLIDGIPMLSAVSSYYGLDAIPVAGVESLEVSRSGGSVLAPEAIGGTVNVIMRDPKDKLTSFESYLGNGGERLVSLYTTTQSESQKFNSLISLQYNHQDSWDQDNNLVGESPNRESVNTFVKSSYQLNSKNKISAYYTFTNLEIAGGFVDLDSRPSLWTDPNIRSFEGGNVNQKLLSDPASVSEWVEVKRNDYFLKWDNYWSDNTELEAIVGFSRQRQDSMYNFHRFDYQNDDKSYFSRLRATQYAGNHLLEYGLAIKAENYQSESVKLYQIRTPRVLIKDNFNYQSFNGFIQDTWRPSYKFEMKLALMVDRILVDWTKRVQQENEIDSSIFSPRMSFLYRYNDHWNSRFSYSQGYRVPLAFLESEHGLNEEGFEIEIDKLEKSDSFGHVLHAHYGDWEFSLSNHYTRIHNLAYASSQIAAGEPAVFENSEQAFDIYNHDLEISYAYSEHAYFDLRFEFFDYQDRYKNLLPTAAIEKRVSFDADIHLDEWEWHTGLSWIPERNIYKYKGYNEHFNETYQSGLLDLLRRPKNKRSKDYFLLNTYLSKSFKKNYKFYFAIDNILDQTQVGMGSSPLTYASHGDPSHFHVDNNHIWGPNRGRTFKLGFQMAFN